MISNSGSTSIWNKLAINVWNANAFNWKTYLILISVFSSFGLLYWNTLSVLSIAKMFLAVSISITILIPLSQILHYCKNKYESKVLYLNIFCAVAFFAGASVAISRDLLLSLIDRTQLNLEPLIVFAGALFTLYVLLLASYFSESRKNVKQVLSQAEEVQTKQKDFTQLASELIKRETKDLQERTKHALLPIVESIEKNLKAKSHADLFVADQIRDAIQNKIRPFSRTIRTFDPYYYGAAAPEPQRAISTPAFPKVVQFREIFSPSLGILLPAPLYLLGFAATNPLHRIWIPLLELALCFFLLSATNRFMGKREMKTLFAFVIIGVAVVSASLIVALASAFLTQKIDDFRIEFLRVNGLGPIKFWLIAALILFEKRYRLATNKLISAQHALALAPEQLSQQIWILRRNWSYLVHGVIQTNLLAAQLIAEKGKADDASMQQIRGNLHRALESLKTPPRPLVDFFEELNAISETWRGVVDITCFIDSSVEAVLLKSPDWQFAMNEIIKEAVSNAAKHGEASAVEIYLSLDGENLKFDIANDGIKPKKKSSKSLGTLMLDELASNWSLELDKEDELVHLRGRLVKSASMPAGQNAVN